MFSQSVELFEFLKQHIEQWRRIRISAKNVAGRSKHMANKQELGAAFRFSLAGLDGRVKPRFSQRGNVMMHVSRKPSSGPLNRETS